MSLLDNVEVQDDIQEEVDSLGGGALDSDVYDMVIDKAFLTQSEKTKAVALNLHYKGRNGITFRNQQWIKSGNAKGNKNYYIDKAGNKQYLPGFNIANAIANITNGKPLNKLNTETKKVMVYSKDAKEEVPTDVEMVMDLLGKKVKLGILQQIIDKTAYNEDTQSYEPTGETIHINEVGKVFSYPEGLTTVEKKAGETEGIFITKWLKKFKDTVKDKSKGTGATAGAPKVKKQATKKAAPVESLFDD